MKIDEWVSLIILPEDETLKLSSRIYFVILLIYQDLLFQQDVLGVWEGGVISTSAKEGGWRLYFHPCLSVCLDVNILSKKKITLIQTKFGGQVGRVSGTNGFDFGENPNTRIFSVFFF